MKPTCIFFALSVGLALAVACGGSTSNPSGGGSPDSGSGSGGGLGSSGGSSGGVGQDAGVSRDGGAVCQCPASQACCVARALGMTTSSCAANQSSCPTGTITVACTTSQSCGGGQQCCYTPFGGGFGRGGNAGATRVTQCMNACAAGTSPVCATDADCTGGATCQPVANGVYGFTGICRQPPSCRGTADCTTAGQIRCLGTGASPNTCQAACPVGSDQVCGVPTDCAAGQLCCSSTANGGGGSSTCQPGTCPTGTSTICATSGDCSMGLVCCQGGGQTCQVQSACGMPGNREICATSADCPPDFPVCRGMTCRSAPDGGTTSDSGAPGDAATGG